MPPNLRSDEPRRQTFAQAFDPRDNAFGFLRLVLAVLVIFSHSFPLGGFGIDSLEAYTRGRHTIGLVAVGMFFVLSGFLICRSASTAPSIGRFLWHRFLRIFPGYWACLIICSCLFAPLIALHNHASILSVFCSPLESPASYVLGNAALFHGSDASIPAMFNIDPQGIAGLLSHNPVPRVFNGSLWTLPYEIACYLAVAFFGLCGVLRRGRAIVLAVFFALWSLYSLFYLDPQTFREWLPYRLLSLLLMLSLFFAAGCVCFLYRDEIPFSTALFCAAMAVLVASLPLGAFGLAAPVALSYALLWLAFRLPLGSFDGKGDFSYGTYIYAFPVQQALAAFGAHSAGFSIYFGCTLLLTAVLAVLSYRLVEAPCLRFRNAQLPRLGRPATAVAPLVEVR